MLAFKTGRGTTKGTKLTKGITAMRWMLALAMMVLPLGAQESGVKLVEAARKQVGVTISYDPEYVALKYRPGDLVTCTVPPNLPHIRIVSDRKTAEGVPLVIHNIGRGAREEDVLFTYALTGHYRWK